MKHDTPSLYFEDLVIDRKVRITSSHMVTRDEIVSFRESFDPAHRVAAGKGDGSASPSARLTASNWHVCSLFMRIICDGFLLGAASQGATALPDCRWLAPVRPGDVLSGHYRVLHKRLSRSRPDIGLAEIDYTVSNQRQDVVMTWLVVQMFGLRSVGDAG